MKVTDGLVAAVKACDELGNDCTTCRYRNTKCGVETEYHSANKDYAKAMDVRRFLRPLVKRLKGELHVV